VKKSHDCFYKDKRVIDGLESRCKDCKGDYKKKRYSENPNKFKERVERYRLSNLGKVKEAHRESDKKRSARIEVKLKKSQWLKNKRNNDPNFRIACCLRSRTCLAIKAAGGKKSSKSESLWGCSLDFLIGHLESKFTQGMSWGKFGLRGIHIDHIRPCSSFDLTDQAQQKECFHYSNLQPLWAFDNLTKGKSWDNKQKVNKDALSPVYCAAVK
jgi:hypothetical protein